MKTETDKPLNVATGVKLEEIKKLTGVEASASAPYFLVAMANMSRKGAQIYQVSVDGGKNWGEIKPPIGPNCQYNSVPECNTHNQWSPMTTVNCGYLITLCIRWQMPDGSQLQGNYQGNTLADCNSYKGILVGFTD